MSADTDATNKDDVPGFEEVAFNPRVVMHVRRCPACRFFWAVDPAVPLQYTNECLNCAYGSTLQKLDAVSKERDRLAAELYHYGTKQTATKLQLGVLVPKKPKVLDPDTLYELADELTAKVSSDFASAPPGTKKLLRWMRGRSRAWRKRAERITFFAGSKR